MPKIYAPANPPTDSLFSNQYQFDASLAGNIAIGNIWDDYSGKAVDVAIFDQGIDFSHKDLSGEAANGHFDSVKGRPGQPPLGLLSRPSDRLPA